MTNVHRLYYAPNKDFPELLGVDLEIEPQAMDDLITGVEQSKSIGVSWHAMVLQSAFEKLAAEPRHHQVFMLEARTFKLGEVREEQSARSKAQISSLSIQSPVPSDRNVQTADGPPTEPEQEVVQPSVTATNPPWADDLRKIRTLLKCLLATAIIAVVVLAVR
jgi:hypothetical protein